jgi:hypothetical protein
MLHSSFDAPYVVSLTGRAIGSSAAGRMPPLSVETLCAGAFRLLECNFTFCRSLYGHISTRTLRHLKAPHDQRGTSSLQLIHHTELGSLFDYFLTCAGKKCLPYLAVYRDLSQSTPAPLSSQKGPDQGAKTDSRHDRMKEFFLLPFA